LAAATAAVGIAKGAKASARKLKKASIIRIFLSE